MQFDGNDVANLTLLLQLAFQKLDISMNEIINSNKTMTSSNNWESPTNDYYSDQFEDVIENYLLLKDKYNNIVEYLEGVIENYNSMNKKSTVSAE